MRVLRIILSLCLALALGACVTKQTYNKEVNVADTYQALNTKLSTELGADQAQITQLQNQLKVTLVNDILFPEGGYRLSPKGEATLAKIAPTLANLPGQQIIVQGFTDNVPIVGELKQRFPSNLELSSARADDVVRYLTANGVPGGSISAQGFGDARPVASNDTPQGRAKNRRVEIVISAANRP
jgi:chemotaxis protein MotB